jgi:hypothetical protein
MARRAPVRQTHDVLRDASAAGHRSPGAQPDRAADRSALSVPEAGECEARVVPRNRRCGSSTAILPFYSQIANPL